MPGELMTKVLFELLLKRVYSLRTKPEGVNTQMKALDYVVMVCCLCNYGVKRVLQFVELERRKQ